MDADTWLAEFARREGQWRFERTMRWAEIAKPAVVAPAVAGPVVLEAGHDVELDDEAVPRSAQAVARAGIAAGWAVRVVASVAVEPAKGLVSVVTVRGRRHDERFWAAWNRGGFDTGWYVGPGGLERLGGERMHLRPAGAVSVDVMTVPQIKTLAGERGIRIPTKFKKAEVIAHVKAAGLTASEPPPPTRGVLDVVEGVHGPRQWVDLLERQEMDRAVGLISAAFPGLSLTRQ